MRIGIDDGNEILVIANILSDRIPAIRDQCFVAKIKRRRLDDKGLLAALGLDVD